MLCEPRKILTLMVHRQMTGLLTSPACRRSFLSSQGMALRARTPMESRRFDVVRSRTKSAYRFGVSIVLSLLVSLATGGARLRADELRQDRPNVILILADDLAIGDLDGGDGHPSRTPHLDRFARESVRFDHAYSASCVCAPARAALLTGRCPHRTGVVTLNMNTYPKLTRLRRDEVTIADMMRQAGYATGLIGKWHVGRGNDYHPLARGFDHFQGFDGSQVLSYFDYSLDLNGVNKPIDGKYLTNDLSARAIEYVRRHRGHPFFLHLAHYAPHRPLEAPVETIRRYREQGFDRQTATIYAMIEVMDRGIGELLEELEKLSLRETTIVIFASDNGPDPLTGERFNHGLRGTKYQIYEGGIRVPLFVRWPRELRPGTRQQLVHFVDLLPTILELCGIDAEPANPIDGVSFANVLRNQAAKFAPTRYWQWNRGVPNYTHNAAVREGRFKLVRPFVTRGIRVADSSLSFALYDVLDDPSETRDLAGNLPEKVAELKPKLLDWSRSVENDRLRDPSAELQTANE